MEGARRVVDRKGDTHRDQQGLMVIGSRSDANGKKVHKV